MSRLLNIYYFKQHATNNKCISDGNSKNTPTTRASCKIEWDGISVGPVNQSYEYSKIADLTKEISHIKTYGKLCIHPTELEAFFTHVYTKHACRKVCELHISNTFNTTTGNVFISGKMISMITKSILCEPDYVINKWIKDDKAF